MPSDADLEAYLDEELTISAMADIEATLRKDARLAERLRTLIVRRDAGVHTLGAIWRRHGLSCFSRRQLGNYLLGVLPKPETEYTRFHLEIIGCRVCQANLEDLKQQEAEAGSETADRRRRYFQSSAGYLSGKRAD